MIMTRSFRSIRDNVGMVAQLPCWISIESDCSRQFLSNQEISDRAAADRYGWRDNGATGADVGQLEELAWAAPATGRGRSETSARRDRFGLAPQLIGDHWGLVEIPDQPSNHLCHW